ncbi:MAG: hypothetical protein ACK4R6_05135 [Spirosomataceae bacterium]
MRPISKCVFFLLVSSNVLNAQLVRPGELIKRKSEQRVNQKIEGAIDGALDKVFGVGKSKQGASNQSESRELERKVDSASISAFDAMQAMKSIRLGVSPKEKYSFTSSFIVLSREYDKKGIEEVTKMKYHFSSDANAMAVTFFPNQQGGKDKSMEDMDAFVIDFDLSAVFTFMRMDEKKVFMGTGFSPTKMGTNTPEKEIKTKITPTNQTKKIGNYVCDGYLVEEEGEEMLVWISKTRVEFFEEYLKKMSENSKQFSKMLPSMKSSSYQYHPELVKLSKEGRMFLGMSKLGDKYESFDIEFRDFIKDDFFILKSSEYSSMMGN